MVYYLKYRPKTLAELDNPEVARLMTKYLALANTPHAFLFTGPKGTGKTSTARIVAKCINCKATEVKGQACGVCETCLSIEKGEALDILEIDAASNRGIDEIRDLREKIKLAPFGFKFKVYIIDEVHMLTTEAFNALLKTLEEPPAHAIFILATTEAHKVPETIISRCVRVEFHKATPSEISTSLGRIIKGEKLKVGEDAVLAIAGAADGSFRDAAKLLEEQTLEGKVVTLAAVMQKVGTSDAVVISTFLKNLQAKKTALLLTEIAKMTESGRNVRQFFLQLTKKLEEMLISSFSVKSEWDRGELMRALKIFSQSFVEAKDAVVATLPFEMAIVEYCENFSATPAPTDHVKPATVTSGIPVASTPISADLTEKWGKYLEALKPHNHSLVGVLRSCRPVALSPEKFTIEAAYKFHAERLSDPKVMDVLAEVAKDVLGLEGKVEVVLKKR